MLNRRTRQEFLKLTSVAGLSFLLGSQKKTFGAQAVAAFPNTTKDHPNQASNMLAAENTRQANEQVIRDFLRLLSEKKMDAWIELWTEDAVQDMPFSPAGFPLRVEGREAIRKHYSNLPNTVGRMVFPDLVIYPMVDPNWVLAEYRGEIEVLATGRPYNNRYCGLFQLREGRIALFREYYNPIVFTQAFGDPSKNFGVTNP